MTKCTTCGIDKPDSEYYQNKTRDKLQQPCKACRIAYQREHRAKIRTQQTIPDDKLKCHKCGRILPRTNEYFFFDDRQGKHYPPCRDCKKKKVAAYKRLKAAQETVTPEGENPTHKSNTWLFRQSQYPQLFERSTIDPNERVIERPRRRNENYNPLNEDATWLPDWMKKEDKSA